MYIVTVLFKIQTAYYPQFLAEMRSNANTSVQVEPGCHQFDVCEGGSSDAPEVFLYEVYGSQADFLLHLASQHFLAFNALTAPWVADKQVSTFQRLE
jgi:(4S)-4-hydroxy-5-phosphonooxypentane-2,3-dione isomerase